MPKYPIVSENSAVQAFYVKVRKNLKATAKREGKSVDEVADHRFAEMLALRQTPKCMTDREFFAGQGTLADQFKSDPEHLKLITDNAKRRGYTPGINDVYVPTLAKEPGDPAAFISPAGGRNQLKKAAERQGMGGMGAVNVKAREATEDPLKRNYLAPDVMNRLVAHETRKLKREGKRMRKEEIREKVLANHRYKM